MESDRVYVIKIDGFEHEVKNGCLLKELCDYFNESIKFHIKGHGILNLISISFYRNTTTLNCETEIYET
jgi:hypothetical protein